MEPVRRLPVCDVCNNVSQSRHPDCNTYAELRAEERDRFLTALEELPVSKAEDILKSYDSARTADDLIDFLNGLVADTKRLDPRWRTITALIMTFLPLAPEHHLWLNSPFPTDPERIAD